MQNGPARDESGRISCLWKEQALSIEGKWSRRGEANEPIQLELEFDETLNKLSGALDLPIRVLAW
jgi:hypothetical protein